jgi:hypothetical protein
MLAVGAHAGQHRLAAQRRHRLVFEEETKPRWAPREAPEARSRARSDDARRPSPPATSESRESEELPPEEFPPIVPFQIF